MEDTDDNNTLPKNATDGFLNIQKLFWSGVEIPGKKIHRQMLAYLSAVKWHGSYCPIFTPQYN